MRTISEYKDEKDKLRNEMEIELEDYAKNWFKDKPNLRLMSGMGTWFVETKYKDTEKWVKVDEKDDGTFGYHDEESEDYDFIPMPHMEEYSVFNNTLEDWSCENIYLSCDINY